MEELKKALDHLVGKFGVRNEAVIALSQYIDGYISEEQRNRLPEKEKKAC